MGSWERLNRNERKKLGSIDSRKTRPIMRYVDEIISLGDTRLTVHGKMFITAFSDYNIDFYEPISKKEFFGRRSSKNIGSSCRMVLCETNYSENLFAPIIYTLWDSFAYFSPNGFIEIKKDSGIIEKKTAY